jgi:hypothetical protein
VLQFLSRWGAASWLRFAGLAALTAGLVWACRAFPTRPAERWAEAHVFALDEEECRALRDGRATTEWLAPAALAAPVSVAAVAQKFRLELPLVCAANKLPAACGGQTRAPGTGRLVLPLYREPPPESGAR